MSARFHTTLWADRVLPGSLLPGSLLPPYPDAITVSA